MLKLLEDLQCWDQEKEDSWNKRINDRQKKIDAIKAQKSSKTEERARRSAEKKAAEIAA